MRLFSRILGKFSKFAAVLFFVTISCPLHSVQDCEVIGDLKRENLKLRD